MNDRARLIAYAVAVTAIAFIHDPAVLGAGLLVSLLASGKRRLQLFRRCLGAVLAANLAVGLGYVGVAWWRGDFHPEFLLIFNLRVLLLVYLGFWLAAVINLPRALARWPMASLVAAIAISQARAFERLIRDFRAAFTSRNPLPPSLAARGRHAASQAETLLDKSLAHSSEVGLAMRSRGVFDA